MKLAGIDIGSNAVRLLLCNVYQIKGEVVFKKANFVRLPIRLGEDTFLRGKISAKKIDKLLKCLNAFKYLIDVHDAVDYRACATSAMRDASNRNEIIDRIRAEVGLRVEVIDGKTEADIIYSNHVEEHLDASNSYLYIDIGGGSTEITLFSKNKTVASQSFNIGTIRMLHNQVNKESWNGFKKWVSETTAGYQPLIAIGSGGNINKLHKMAGRKEDKPVTYNRLKGIQEMLSSYTYEERIGILGLNPDRADVIMPACRILLSVMKNAAIDKMIIPQIGLSDGIIHQLYEKNKEKIILSF